MESNVTATEEELQEYFNQDFNELREADEDEIDFIEQCHVGDMLIEKYESDHERFKLWRVLDCNGGGIQVEYCGKYNNYCYQTVLIDN